MSDSAYEQWHDIPATADDPNALRGRRVLVMGLGLLGGGVAPARYAVEQGAAEVVVTDLRSAEMLAPQRGEARRPAHPLRARPARDPADFARAEVVVRNPSVRRDSPYLAAARAAGARVEMEIAWFFRACRGTIAGVTGTRGKSTTTTLLHAILDEAGMRPLLGGNLGGIETLSLLPEITPDRWVVLELGNWMLEGLHTIRRSPHLAIFTNLLPDHLDAYDSMEDYGEAKSASSATRGWATSRSSTPTTTTAGAMATKRRAATSGSTAPSAASPGRARIPISRVPSPMRTPSACVARITWAMSRRRRWRRS